MRQIPPRLVRRSASDYVAFASLASRLARVPKPQPITGGDHWKL